MKVFKNHMRRYIKLRSQKRNGLFIFPGALILQKVEKIEKKFCSGKNIFSWEYS